MSIELESSYELERARARALEAICVTKIPLPTKSMFGVTSRSLAKIRLDISSNVFYYLAK